MDVERSGVEGKGKGGNFTSKQATILPSFMWNLWTMYTFIELFLPGRINIKGFSRRNLQMCFLKSYIYEYIIPSSCSNECLHTI